MLEVTHTNILNIHIQRQRPPFERLRDKVTITHTNKTNCYNVTELPYLGHLTTTAVEDHEMQLKVEKKS